MLIRTPSDLGAVILQARVSRKLSQAELGKRAQLHQPKISEIERGKSGVGLDTLLRVLAALQLSMSIIDATRSEHEVATVVDAEEPGYDDNIDLDEIANTGLKK